MKLFYTDLPLKSIKIDFIYLFCYIDNRKNIIK